MKSQGRGLRSAFSFGILQSGSSARPDLASITNPLSAEDEKLQSFVSNQRSSDEVEQQGLDFACYVVPLLLLNHAAGNAIA